MANTTYNPAMDECDPVAALVRCIRDEMPGLVRHDLDAKSNGWDPYTDPESGYVWQEAERRLLEAAGVEDLESIHDSAYDDLCEATWNLLLDDGEEE